MTSNVTKPSNGRFTADFDCRLTTFADLRAQTLSEFQCPASELERLLQTTSAVEKGKLPLLKAARLGDQRSRRGSLRHDSNICEVSGVEVEYDGEKVSLDAVVEVLRKAGVGAIVYTSPSHRPETPRWRVLAFFLRLLPGSERSRMAGRLNGLLGGILTPESFSLSQPYYYGFIENNEPNHQVILIEGDLLDTREDLDAGAIEPQSLRVPRDTRPAFDEEALIGEVDWLLVSHCTGLVRLETVAPDLHGRLESDLASDKKLLDRWEGGVAGLIDTTRSGRDRSVVLMLRSRDYTITEAIACAVAWGCDNPTLGRGLDICDKAGREINWYRYWVRCWASDYDLPATKLEELARSPKAGDHIAINPFPEICREAPGMVGEIARALGRSSYTNLPWEMLISASLIAISHAAQNRFMVGDPKSPTALQLYLILIADTGVGKTALSKALSDLFGSATAAKGLLEDVASAPALLRQLERLAPQMPWGPTVLLIPDEFGLKMQARGAKGATHAKETIDEIMRLYGRGDGLYRGKAYADVKNTIQPIYRPCLQVYGITTEDSLATALSEADATSGLTNRFVVVQLSGRDMPLKRSADVDRRVPEGIATFLQTIGTTNYALPLQAHEVTEIESHADPRIRGILAAAKTQSTGSFGASIGIRMAPYMLPLAPEAALYLDETLRDFVNQKTAGASPLERSAWVRAIQQVRVIAGILALGQADLNVAIAPTVTKADCEWAWAFVRWSVQSWLRMYATKISSNDEEHDMKSIKELLGRVADFAIGGKSEKLANHGNAKANSDVCATGFMPRSIIGRQTRIKAADLSRALEALVANEEVESRAIDLGESRKVQAYRLI